MSAHPFRRDLIASYCNLAPGPGSLEKANQDFTIGAPPDRRIAERNEMARRDVRLLPVRSIRLITDRH